MCKEMTTGKIKHHTTECIVALQLRITNINKVDTTCQRGDTRKACIKTHGTEAMKATGKGTNLTETDTIIIMKIMDIARGVKDI